VAIAGREERERGATRERSNPIEDLLAKPEIRGTYDLILGFDTM